VCLGNLAEKYLVDDPNTRLIKIALVTILSDCFHRDNLKLKDFEVHTLVKSFYSWCSDLSKLNTLPMIKATPKCISCPKAEAEAAR